MDPVVLVPAYREHNSLCDRISITHLVKHLSNYRIVVVKPMSLDWSLRDFESIRFSDHFFRDRTGYNKLLLSSEFYQAFADHSHMLIYQLDALVFRDELLAWCGTEYDYIGASWYRATIERYDGYKWPFAPAGCGNGGFSLRRIDAFLGHLNRRRRTSTVIAHKVARLRLTEAAKLLRYSRHLNPRNYRQHQSLNEDVYFGIFGQLIEPALNVATPKDGDRFAFEHGPHELFERSGRKLPFGCHAWYKHADSLRFWIPYLLWPN